MTPAETNAPAHESDYLRYRGKCKEYVDKLVSTDNSLRAVRGHYHCPFWGEQPHWWAVDGHGKIIDPTSAQFPSKGGGEYVEFNGKVSCSECGKQMNETDPEVRFESNYCFCSTKCNMRFVGL